MEWDAVGAIGEFLGALAVVGTLICLAIQVRAQIEESRVFFCGNAMPAAKPEKPPLRRLCHEVVTVTRSDFLCPEKHIYERG